MFQAYKQIIMHEVASRKLIYDLFQCRLFSYVYYLKILVHFLPKIASTFMLEISHSHSAFLPGLEEYMH